MNEVNTDKLEVIRKEINIKQQQVERLVAGADGTPQIFQTKFTNCELDVGNVMCYAMEVKGLLSPLRIKIQEVQGFASGIEIFFSTKTK